MNRLNTQQSVTIHIEDLEILAIIGILDFERTTVQKIIVDVTIDYFYKNSAFINYAEVIALIEKCLIDNKYELLEEALSDIQKEIFKQYSQISKLNIKITKPNIIKNAKVALSFECLNIL